MKPGLKLDELVEDKVMRRKKGWRTECDCHHPAPRHTHRAAPDYSSFIDYAWRVVEKLRKQGYDVDVTARPGLEWGCRVAPRGEFNTPDVHFVAASDAPHAICLAALKAVEK